MHSVTSRVKDRASLSGKLTRSGKHYESLFHVTDIVGIRVITYFDDELDRIGDLIARHFVVDRERSVDKRKALDVTQFGYLSLHFICSMTQQRLALDENTHCSGLVCEVQVRTILQHAWAEIEHDLGYKAGVEVALPLRRRFSRLAGLLELADGEFTRLRDDITAYANEVREKLVSDPADVRIDEVSLREFLTTDPASTALDEKMANFSSATLDPMGPRFDSHLAEELRDAGIETIAQLKSALVTRGDLILDCWRRRTAGERWDTLHNGLASYHLFQILAVERGGWNALLATYEKFGIGSGDRAEHARTAAAHIDAARRHLGLIK
jgi:putative GTP pyrophosphokinase